MLLGNDARLRVVDSTEPARSIPDGGGFVVQGAAQTAGSMLHVNLKLSRDDSDTILWSASITRPTSELDALREQMAATVAGVAVCALGTADRGLDGSGPRPSACCSAPAKRSTATGTCPRG